jgi:uncharacterized protein YbaR (Trm112 family)
MLPDRKFIEMLRCPVTRQPVEAMPRHRLRALNEAIAAGGARRVDGTTVQDALQAALVTRDGRRAYPVRDGIPVMLADEGIELDAGAPAQAQPGD